MEAARRVSTATNRPPPEEEVEEPSLAQKLLLGEHMRAHYLLTIANEENTFNIADLWVSAAVAQEGAVFEEDDDDDDVIESTPQITPGATPLSEDPNSTRRRRIVSSAFGRSFGHRLSTSRRFSASSGAMPAIFSNTGVETAISLEDSPTDPFFPSPAPERRPGGVLEAITEQPVEVVEERPSTFKSLPLMMILQYGLLALHNTTHDQLFLSFLVT